MWPKPSHGEAGLLAELMTACFHWPVDKMGEMREGWREKEDNRDE